MGVIRKWLGLGQKANEYAEAKAEHSFDAHSDPQIQLEQAIRGAQEQQQRLESLVATVVGNQHHAEAQLHRLMDQEDALTKDVQASLDAGNEAQARNFAVSLAGIRQQVESQKAFVLKATTDAQNAKDQLQENAEALQQAMAQRASLLSELDQTKMQEQMNEATKQLTEVGANHIVPTLADVQDKIDARNANAQGASEISDMSVGKMEMDIRHTEHMASADSILAEFKKSAPAGVTPPKPS